MAGSRPTLGRWCCGRPSGRTAGVAPRQPGVLSAPPHVSIFDVGIVAWPGLAWPGPVVGMSCRSGISSFQAGQLVAAGAEPAGAGASAEQLAVWAALQVEIAGLAVRAWVDRLSCQRPGVAPANAAHPDQRKTPWSGASIHEREQPSRGGATGSPAHQQSGDHDPEDSLVLAVEGDHRGQGGFRRLRRRTLSRHDQHVGRCARCAATTRTSPPPERRRRSTARSRTVFQEGPPRR